MTNEHIDKLAAAEPAGESPDGWKCPQCEVVNSRRFAMCVRCSAERVNACGQTWAEFCAELDGKPAADSPPLHESQTTDVASAGEPTGGLDVESLARKITTDLFTNGAGQPGNRLVLELSDKSDGGGWCSKAVFDRIGAMIHAALPAAEPAGDGQDQGHR